MRKSFLFFGSGKCFPSCFCAAHGGQASSRPSPHTPVIGDATGHLYQASGESRPRAQDSSRGLTARVRVVARALWVDQNRLLDAVHASAVAALGKVCCGPRPTACACHPDAALANHLLLCALNDGDLCSRQHMHMGAMRHQSVRCDVHMV